MCEDRERCGFAVLVFELRKICFPRLTLAEEEHRRFGKRPASVDSADLFTRGAHFFALGCFGTCHQATLRDELWHAGKAAHGLHLIEED